MNRSSSFFWTSDTTHRVEETAEEENFYVADPEDDDGGLDPAPPPPPPPPPILPPSAKYDTIAEEETKPFWNDTEDYGSSRDSGRPPSPFWFSGAQPSPIRTSSPNPFTSPRSAWRKRVKANRHLLRLQVVYVSGGICVRMKRFHKGSLSLTGSFFLLPHSIWHVGHVEVKEGVVEMRFRVTLFWNDTLGGHDKGIAASPGGGTTHRTAPSEWNMRGRRRAVRTDWSEDTAVLETIDVPPISILNAVSFDELGGAEVTMVDNETRLLRWTCMYAARVFQADHIRVDQFPHDTHNLKLKIGILADRGRNERWDRTKFPLALATEDDSMGSTRIPHGLVVDHVTIPDFTYDPNGLLFEFLPLQFGARGQHTHESECDNFLQVTLPIVRLSGHYDYSIMPMLALLNVVAVTCIPRNFDSATASTETMLSIAFVQVGIRLSIDSRLPSVGYQIKMQRVMNQCFWLLCALVLESNIIFYLVTKRYWEIDTTDVYDFWMAVVALLYTFYIMVSYYSDRPTQSGLLSSVKES